MFYFAYGSNMSTRRLRQRVPSANRIGRAMLQGHQLKFHKISNDGSAKCDALYTGGPEDTVLGVLFEIPAPDSPILDRVEGLGFGYERKQVMVELDDGNRFEAFVYYATRINPALKPFDWYKQHVLTGARENNFPETYINALESIESIQDSDIDRHEMEIALYR